MTRRIVSKTVFKRHASAYLRRVELGDVLCITHRGQPVADILPQKNSDVIELAALHGWVRKYKHPLDPVGVGWQATSTASGE